MGAAQLMSRPRSRSRWSDLAGVERVALYTCQSLYVLLWGLNAYTLLSVGLDPDEHGQAVALLGGGALVTAFGFAAMVSVLRRFPTVQPPSWRGLAPLLLVSGGYYTIAATSWNADVRAAAVTVVVVTLTLALGLLPGRRMPLGLVALSGVLFAIASGEAGDSLIGFLVAGAVLITGRASMWTFGIVTELDAARRAQAQLAVAEERLRFSRDVHDVLGRRLSTIAVLSELAATLARRGDEGAADRMLEVHGVAHTALLEARDLARGYRAADFLKELDGARSLLRSAGIELQQNVDTLPRAWHEPAAWIVRESVTNVLRHSSAQMVHIAYSEGELRVGNDKPHPDGPSDGAGLRGLRERLSPLGATLVAGPDGDAHWAVVAQLPGAGPLSATRKATAPA
jgi:two-component system sensor histidine kinase DesK